MLKKITAYSFIMIANIFLLAQAVLPHHHHELQVCIDSSHCTDDATCCLNSTESDHQHDGQNNLDICCVLKQAFISPSLQGRFLKSLKNCTDNHNHNFFILSNLGYEDLQPVLIPLEDVPDFPPFLISFLTTSLGLRAPPIV